jgi:hypothetical protein
LKNLSLCALYGVLGCLEDYIVVWYYRFIAEKRPVHSAVISWFHTLLAVFVVASVITSESVLPLLCYATGGAIATYLGVRMNRK